MVLRLLPAAGPGSSAVATRCSASAAPDPSSAMQDPPDEARQRADEIYRRLMRELRADLERRMRIPSPDGETPREKRLTAARRASS